jgi:O-antigen/teichoic acid export membrane protein
MTKKEEIAPSEGSNSRIATNEFDAASTRARPNGIVTNAAWNSGYTVWTMVISFILTPTLILHLGLEQYGILLIVWSITGIVGTLNLGLGEATLRYVARYHGAQDMAGVNRVFGATLSLYVVLCGVISLGLITLSPYMARWLNVATDMQDLVSWLLRLSALGVMFSIVMSLFGAVAPALQRYEINTKINIIASVIRFAGYILLALAGQGILYIVILDLAITLITFCFVVRAAKKLLPSLSLTPSFSFLGLREIAGYSIFSFLTFLFHKLHRECGKLLLSRFLGPVPVTYLATPDNLAQRLHEVIAGGVEASLPRFSADRDNRAAESLFWRMTWVGLAFSLILLIPFSILVGDFLSLWINAEFSEHSKAIGQLLGAYLISQGAFVAPAAYFRGTGKPWVVTLVILGSLTITVISGLILIPSLGAIGVGYAYFAGSAAPFLGVVVGSFYAFGWSAGPKLTKTVATPLLSAIIAAGFGLYISRFIGAESWFKLAINGVILATITAVLVFVSDYLVYRAESTALRLVKKVRQKLPYRTLRHSHN